MRFRSTRSMRVGCRRIAAKRKSKRNSATPPRVVGPSSASFAALARSGATDWSIGGTLDLCFDLGAYEGLRALPLRHYRAREIER